MMYPRTIFAEIKAVLDDPEIIVITGMRRVGKTTLLNEIYRSVPSPNKVLLDLENPLYQMLFQETNYDQIIQNLSSLGLHTDEKMTVLLDEIQTIPWIVKPMKYLYDHYGVKFIVTGSSSFYIRNMFPESLAGRKYIFQMFPLSFQEFVGFRGKSFHSYSSWAEKDRFKNQFQTEQWKPLYTEYLQYGAFPQVALATNITAKKRSLQDIFTSYFEKEVKQLSDFRNIQKFQDLLLLLMRRVSSKLDITKLSQECGLSRDTVYSYLSFLEKTYFMQFLRPFTRNIDREISGARKGYCADHGLLQSFSSYPTGSVLENAVLTQIRTNVKSIQYYQKRNGKEIDFIVDQEIALEVKETGTKEDLYAVEKLAISLGLKEWYIVTRNYIDYPGFIPAYMV